jgi:hypothetical protein
VRDDRLLVHHARDLLWQVCFRRKFLPHQLTGGTTDSTTKNTVALEDADIRAYVPLSGVGSRHPAFFAQTDFTYDPPPTNTAVGSTIR